MDPRLTAELMIAAREAAGLSRRDVARRTGMQVATIDAAERGDHSLSLRTLIRHAWAIRATLGLVFVPAGTPSPLMWRRSAPTLATLDALAASMGMRLDLRFEAAEAPETESVPAATTDAVPAPTMRDLKSAVAAELLRQLRARSLSRAEAGRLTGLGEAALARLAAGRSTAFTLDRLLDALWRVAPSVRIGLSVGGGSDLS